MGIQVLPDDRGNTFNRVGRGFAQGLANSIPKEVERYRLSQGLEALSKDKNLTPFERLSKLSTLPGTTPQLIQSGAELLKQEGIRNAYKKGSEPKSEIPKNNIKGVNFLDQIKENQKNKGKTQTVPSDLSRQDQALSNPPAASDHPLDEKFIPATPWNQQMDEQAMNEAFDSGKATNFPEARAYADNLKNIYEETPEKYRKQYEYNKSIDNETDKLFDEQMQTRIQKAGSDTFKDLSGDLQLNLKKQAKNSVATGKMTPSQAAEYYSTKALDLVKDKGRVLQIANRDIFDRLLPHKKDESLNNLMSIGKTFDDLGSSEDYYNLLKTDQLDENDRQQGMGLSPGGAAIIAYPRSEKVKSLIKNTKISPKDSSASTKSFADNLIKTMSPKDSLLAIARQMKEQDPNFNEYAYFEYLRENEDQFGTNPRLHREVTQGVSDFFPNWRDIGLFPAFKKSVTND
jgi:hypothetical protein